MLSVKSIADLSYQIGVFVFEVGEILRKGRFSITKTRKVYLFCFYIRQCIHS